MNLDYIMKLFLVTVIVGGILLFAYFFVITINSSSTDADIEEVPIEIGDYYIINKVHDNKNGGIFYVVIDNETGVQYLFMKYGYGGGFTPRYNADGTLYIDKGIEYDAEED